MCLELEWAILGMFTKFGFGILVPRVANTLLNSGLFSGSRKFQSSGLKVALLRDININSVKSTCS